MNDLKSTLQPKKFNILVIGDACWDVYRYGTVDRISPEAPVPIFTVIDEKTRPGMAANVTENLTALGCRVTACLGEFGKKIRLIDSRSGQQVLRIDEDTHNTPLDPSAHDLSFYDAIVVSDYNKGSVSYELVETVRRAYQGPIFVDTKKTDLARFDGCVVKINRSEYQLVRTVCNDLIVTLGPDGANYLNQVYPSLPVDVVDVCGAGDTFLAALTVGFLHYQDMPSAIQLANRASGITVQRLGCYAPSMDEIWNK